MLYFADLYVDGRVVLKAILQKYSLKVMAGISWLRVGSSVEIL